MESTPYISRALQDDVGSVLVVDIVDYAVYDGVGLEITYLARAGVDNIAFELRTRPW